MLLIGNKSFNTNGSQDVKLCYSSGHCAQYYARIVAVVVTVVISAPAGIVVVVIRTDANGTTKNNLADATGQGLSNMDVLTTDLNLGKLTEPASTGQDLCDGVEN